MSLNITIHEEQRMNVIHCERILNLNNRLNKKKISNFDHPIDFPETPKEVNNLETPLEINYLHENI